MYSSLHPMRFYHKLVRDNHRAPFTMNSMCCAGCPHTILTTNIYRKNCCRLRISMYSSFSMDAREFLGVFPLGSATEGSFAW